MYSDKIRKRQATKWRRRLVQETIRLIKQSTPCYDCGKSYHYEVMEFDHVKGDKVDGVSQMIVRGFALSTILAEVEKCDLVCANCHRLRTVMRRHGTVVHVSADHIDDLRKEVDTTKVKDGIRRLENILSVYNSEIQSN